MDLKTFAQIMSGFASVVAILITMIIHFRIEPRKAEKKKKQQELLNLYGPLYVLVSSRINLVRNKCLEQKRILLGSDPDKKHLLRRNMERYMLKNAGYGSVKLMDAFVEYVSSDRPDEEVTNEFVFTLVKEFNSLKKELDLPYNEEELKTGIPDVIKELRAP